MRWERLFDDLAGQAVELERAERAAEVEGRARSEFAGLGLSARLGPSVGASVRLSCLGGHVVGGVLRHVGPDWLQLDADGAREWLVNLAAVTSLGGVGRLVAPPGAGRVVDSRLGLRHALRVIARDRSGVQLHLTDGRIIDGTPDRVGRDFLELAVHAVGEARRPQAVRQVVVVPFPAVAGLLRSIG